MRVSGLILLSAAILWGGAARAQEIAAQPSAPQSVSAGPAAEGQSTTDGVVPVQAVSAAGPPVAKAKGKGKKEEYTGPAEVVVLAPTPMLDEEGKQRLDPDGKPMFNAPIKQQRDKHGHPLFDEKGKPVLQTAKELGYDKDGHKLHAAKEKPAKAVPVTISRGIYTVDGMPGKAALNYDIADLKYIYLWAPGVGVAVISNAPFPGAKEEKEAFNDKSLTVMVGEHTLQLTSDVRLMKEKHPESAYVLLDRNFALPSHYPAAGYGSTRVAPYLWPGSREQKILAQAAYAPPPPANLMPVILLAPCPQGQMRMPAPRVLPGQMSPVQPCVPVAQAQAARERMMVKTKASLAAAQAKQPAAAPEPVKDISPTAVESAPAEAVIDDTVVQPASAQPAATTQAMPEAAPVVTTPPAAAAAGPQ